MAEGWVVASDSRLRDDVIFLVDRRRNQKSFWSNRLDDVFVYATREAAQAKVDRLQHNRPRVMSLSDARRLVRAAMQADRQVIAGYHGGRDDPF